MVRSQRVVVILPIEYRRDTDQAQVLVLFGAKKFIKAPVDQYASIESVGRQLGKIR